MKLQSRPSVEPDQFYDFTVRDIRAVLDPFTLDAQIVVRLIMAPEVLSLVSSNPAFNTDDLIPILQSKIKISK